MPLPRLRSTGLLFVSAVIQMSSGLAFFVVPDEFKASIYDPLRPFFSVLAAGLVTSGLALFILSRYEMPVVLRRGLGMLTALPPLALSWGFAATHWPGATMQGTLAVCLLLSSWLPESTEPDAVGLGGVAIGVAQGILGLMMLTLPGAPSFVVYELHSELVVRLIGLLGLAGAVASLDRRGRARHQLGHRLAGGLFPCIVAVLNARFGAWSGALTWGIWGLTVVTAPHLLPDVRRRYPSLTGGDPARLSLSVIERVFEDWGWLMATTVVVLSALVGQAAVASPFDTNVFILLLAAYNLLVHWLLKKVGSPERRIFMHASFLTATIGLLIHAHAGPVGHAFLIPMVALPVAAGWALGQTAGVRVLLLSCLVILIGGLQGWLMDGEGILTALGGALAEAAGVIIASAVGMRMAIRQRQLVGDLDGARKDLQRRLRHLQSVDRIGSAVSQSLDQATLLETAAQELGSALHPSRCHLWLLSGDGRLSSVAEYVGPGIAPIGVGRGVWVEPQLLKLGSNGPVAITDIDTDVRLDGGSLPLRQSLQAAGVKSFLAAIIHVNGETLGAMTFQQCHEHRTWTKDEMSLLDALAGPIGLALVHARTLRELMGSYEELRARSEEMQAQREELEAQNEELVAQEEQLRLTQTAFERISHENQLILDSAGVGICRLNARGHITFVNPTAALTLDYPPEDLVGRHVLTLTGPDTSWAASPFQHTLLQGDALHISEGRFRQSGGQMVPVEYACTPVRESGAVVGAVVTFKDITERQAVDRMKDEFISVVSHELRTPLTSIRGSLGLLERGVLGSLPEQGQRMVQIAVQNTDRLVRLINDILDLERMKSGKVSVHKVEVDAAELMLHAAESMQTVADREGIGLSVAPLEAKLWADPDRLVQTLVNLLSNAIKFSEAGSTVWLTAELSGPEVLFRVKDQGRGIPLDKQEQIFERFGQVDASDSRAKGGTGLGLAICRSIAEQHGGRIWVESEPGVGSTFAVALPCGPGLDERRISWKGENA